MKKHVLTESEKYDAIEKKYRMHKEANGRCKHCGKYNSIYNCDLAHKIPAWQRNIEKYGYDVIYHEENMDITCKGKCNDLSNLNPAAHPIEVALLYDKILRKLGGD